LCTIGTSSIKSFTESVANSITDLDLIDGSTGIYSIESTKNVKIVDVFSGSTIITLTGAAADAGFGRSVSGEVCYSGSKMFAVGIPDFVVGTTTTQFSSQPVGACRLYRINQDNTTTIFNNGVNIVPLSANFSTTSPNPNTYEFGARVEILRNDNWNTLSSTRNRNILFVSNPNGVNATGVGTSQYHGNIGIYTFDDNDNLTAISSDGKITYWNTASINGVTYNSSNRGLLGKNSLKSFTIISNNGAGQIGSPSICVAADLCNPAITSTSGYPSVLIFSKPAGQLALFNANNWTGVPAQAAAPSGTPFNTRYGHDIEFIDLYSGNQYGDVANRYWLFVSEPDANISGQANSGQIHVFVYLISSGTWSRTAVLTHPFSSSGVRFGTSLESYGQSLIVCDINGLIFIFKWNGSSWVVNSRIDSDDDANERKFVIKTDSICTGSGWSLFGKRANITGDNGDLVSFANTNCSCPSSSSSLSSSSSSSSSVLLCGVCPPVSYTYSIGNNCMETEPIPFSCEKIDNINNPLLCNIFDEFSCHQNYAIRVYSICNCGQNTPRFLGTMCSQSVAQSFKSLFDDGFTNPNNNRQNVFNSNDETSQDSCSGSGPYRSKYFTFAYQGSISPNGQLCVNNQIKITSIYLHDESMCAFRRAWVDNSQNTTKYPIFNYNIEGISLVLDFDNFNLQTWYECCDESYTTYCQCDTITPVECDCASGQVNNTSNNYYYGPNDGCNINIPGTCEYGSGSGGPDPGTPGGTGNVTACSAQISGPVLAPQSLTWFDGRPTEAVVDVSEALQCSASVSFLYGAGDEANGQYVRLYKGDGTKDPMDPADRLRFGTLCMELQTFNVPSRIVITTWDKNRSVHFVPPFVAAFPSDPIESVDSSYYAIDDVIKNINSTDGLSSTDTRFLSDSTTKLPLLGFASVNQSGVLAEPTKTTFNHLVYTNLSSSMPSQANVNSIFYALNSETYWNWWTLEEQAKYPLWSINSIDSSVPSPFLADSVYDGFTSRCYFGDLYRIGIASTVISQVSSSNCIDFCNADNFDIFVNGLPYTNLNQWLNSDLNQIEIYKKFDHLITCVGQNAMNYRYASNVVWMYRFMEYIKYLNQIDSNSGNPLTTAYGNFFSSGSDGTSDLDMTSFNRGALFRSFGARINQACPWDHLMIRINPALHYYRMLPPNLGSNQATISNISNAIGSSAEENIGGCVVPVFNFTRGQRFSFVRANWDCITSRIANSECTNCTNNSVVDNFKNRGGPRFISHAGLNVRISPISQPNNLFDSDGRYTQYNKYSVELFKLMNLYKGHPYLWESSDFTNIYNTQGNDYVSATRKSTYSPGSANVIFDSGCIATGAPRRFCIKIDETMFPDEIWPNGKNYCASGAKIRIIVFPGCEQSASAASYQIGIKYVPCSTPNQTSVCDSCNNFSGSWLAGLTSGNCFDQPCPQGCNYAKVPAGQSPSIAHIYQSCKISEFKIINHGSEFTCALSYDNLIALDTMNALVFRDTGNNCCGLDQDGTYKSNRLYEVVINASENYTKDLIDRICNRKLCFGMSTRIMNSSGEYVQAGDLKVGDTLKSVVFKNESGMAENPDYIDLSGGWKLTNKTNWYVKNSIVSEVSYGFEDRGVEIDGMLLSGDHPVLVKVGRYYGFKSAQYVSVGDTMVKEDLTLTTVSSFKNVKRQIVTVSIKISGDNSVICENKVVHVGDFNNSISYYNPSLDSEISSDITINNLQTGSLTLNKVDFNFL
jgi:hypothetical protein